jgi:hypothetical protein
MTGFAFRPRDTADPGLARALAWICKVENVEPAQVRSIELDDGEITARIERTGGGCTIVTYPLCMLDESMPDHRTTRSPREGSSGATHR